MARGRAREDVTIYVTSGWSPVSNPGGENLRHPCPLAGHDPVGGKLPLAGSGVRRCRYVWSSRGLSRVININTGSHRAPEQQTHPQRHQIHHVNSLNGDFFQA